VADAERSCGRPRAVLDPDGIGAKTRKEKAMDALALIKLLLMSFGALGLVRLLVIILIGDAESDAAIIRWIHVMKPENKRRA
jgi:hypothetical protein